jgi:hypothetical protein
MRIKKMAAEFKFGLTVQGTTDSGETEWPMDMEDSFMQRVMCMKENGLKTKLMAMEYIRILMEVDTRVNGSKISNMDLVLSNGLMVLSTRDSTSKE